MAGTSPATRVRVPPPPPVNHVPPLRLLRQHIVQRVHDLGSALRAPLHQRSRVGDRRRPGNVAEPLPRERSRTRWHSSAVVGSREDGAKHYAVVDEREIRLTPLPPAKGTDQASLERCLRRPSGGGLVGTLTSALASPENGVPAFTDLGVRGSPLP